MLGAERIVETDHGPEKITQLVDKPANYVECSKHRPTQPGTKSTAELYKTRFSRFPGIVAVFDCDQPTRRSNNSTHGPEGDPRQRSHGGASTK